jgi:amidase
MSGFELQETTIDEIHRAMRGGDVAAADLVRGYLARIEAYDRAGPALNAVLATSEGALARAQELDRPSPTPDSCRDRCTASRSR